MERHGSWRWPRCRAAPDTSRVTIHTRRGRWQDGIDQSVSRDPPFRRSDVLLDRHSTALSALLQRSRRQSMRSHHRSTARSGDRALDHRWYVPRVPMVRLPAAVGQCQAAVSEDDLELPRSGGDGGEHAAHAGADEPAVSVARGAPARPDRGRASQRARPVPVGARAERAVRRQPHDRSPRPRDAHARGLPLPQPPARHVRGRAAPALQRRQLHAQHDRGGPDAGHRGPVGRHGRPRPRGRRPARRPRRAAACTCCSGCARPMGEPIAIENIQLSAARFPDLLGARPRRLAVGAPARRATTCTRRRRTPAWSP